MAEARAIKRLSKCLEIIRTQIEAFSINTPISEIKTSMDLLASEWKEFQALEKTVKGKFDDAHIDTVEKIEQDHFALKQRLIRWETHHELSTAQPHQENSTMQELLLNQSNFLQEISTINKRDSEVRLPRVNIPQFSGNYSEFPSFKDLFEASIDKNEHMSKVHKLQYLKSLLKGEAFKCNRCEFYSSVGKDQGEIRQTKTCGLYIGQTIYESAGIARKLTQGT